jgi:regulatory protein
VPSDTPFRDAEAWLRDRGVERDPIQVPLTPPPAPTTASPEPNPPTASAPDATSAAPPTVKQLQGMVADAEDEQVRRADDLAATPDRSRPTLEDDVAEAVAFLRRSTSTAPQSEGRLRAKLAERGTPQVVIDQALERARRERLVDDPAMAAAIVDERRRKGHSPARIRNDLRARGFTDEVLDDVLRDADAEDPHAAAFAVATDRARRLTGVPADTAFRRVAAHVARRGYPDALARKVARDAVFASRDPERAAGH